jgi:ATP-binding cassette, subfamily F, member 3
VRKCYGDLLVYQNLDLIIERGDRIAVVGVNGAGKSTLAKILAGVEPFQAGERSVGDRVQLSFFAQHQADELDLTANALTIAERAAPAGQAQHARNLLGAFLFSGDAAYKPVSVLSGGEKNRLALIRMLLRPGNFLILDEPTNHLDMRSKQVLQDALAGYTGTLFIVSHDRAFLDPLVTKVLEISKIGARLLPGNVSDYVLKIDAERALAAHSTNHRGLSPPAAAGANSPSTTAPATPQATGGGLSPRDRRKAVAERNQRLAPLRATAAACEDNIQAMEAEKAALEAQLADPAFFKSPEARAAAARYHTLETELEAAMARWERTLLAISAMEAAGPPAGQ